MDATTLKVDYEALSKAVRELWLERQKMQSLSEASSDPRLAIQENVEKALGKLFDLADAPQEQVDGEHIEVCRLLVQIDKCRIEWQKWINWHQTTGEGREGSDELWNELNELQNVYSSEIKPPFTDPHIEAARNPPTSPKQIAMMLEWKDCEGPFGVVWDTARVNRELTTKGSEWTPDYVVPSHLEKINNIKAEFEKRFEPKAIEVAEEGTSRPIETTEELILQGLTASQIKKIHKDTSILDIINEADDLGIKLPEAANLSSYREARLSEKIEEQEKETERRFNAAQLAADADDMSELSSLDDKVVWLHGKGLSPKEIVESLHGEHIGLSHQKVSHLIKKHKKAKKDS